MAVITTVCYCTCVARPNYVRELRVLSHQPVKLVGFEHTHAIIFAHAHSQEESLRHSEGGREGDALFWLRNEFWFLSLPSKPFKRAEL